VHELSICHAIAELARSAAGGRNVEIVRVQIGALRQVVPDSLSFSWELTREHERMPHAELELDLVAAEVRCRSCHKTSPIASRWSVCCPSCASADVEVLRGNEFQVTSLDVS
jgi:hydrogenase nickel incorporation protein HypA/HybF